MQSTTRDSPSNYTNAYLSAVLHPPPPPSQSSLPPSSLQHPPSQCESINSMQQHPLNVSANLNNGTYGTPGGAAIRMAANHQSTSHAHSIHHTLTHSHPHAHSHHMHTHIAAHPHQLYALSTSAPQQQQQQQPTTIQTLGSILQQQHQHQQQHQSSSSTASNSTSTGIRCINGLVSQQQSSNHHGNNTNAIVPINNNLKIVSHGFCDVWQSNLKEGIQLLRCLSLVYSYVAVDTEFPGIVFKLSGDYLDASELAYKNVRLNVSMLRPIQIGFSFMNEGGVSKEDHCTTLQFNMRWDLNEETHAPESIRLLENSGIDFSRLRTDGILAEDFAAELIGSGAVLNPDLKHIGYHSAYDWAYLLKVLTGWIDLPDSYAEFHKHLSYYFPTILDAKVFQAHLINAPKGGLQELADSYNIQRFGVPHQAGSDARLTGEVFFRIIKDERLQIKPDFENLVFGLDYGQGMNLWVPSSRDDLLSSHPDDIAVLPGDVVVLTNGNDERSEELMQDDDDVPSPSSLHSATSCQHRHILCHDPNVDDVDVDDDNVDADSSLSSSSSSS